MHYPEQIRHLIYTTNAVEAYHRMVRKFTKTKSIFPTDDSIRKVVFLSAKEITKKVDAAIKGLGNGIQ
jgi:putative transposase